MRVVYSCALALMAGLLVGPAIGAAGQESARSVAGGGISVPGWTGKIDAGEAQAGQMLNNAKLAQEGDVPRAAVHEPQQPPAPVRRVRGGQ